MVRGANVLTDGAEVLDIAEDLVRWITKGHRSLPLYVGNPVA
jgi:hypothetical protein